MSLHEGYGLDEARAVATISLQRADAARHRDRAAAEPVPVRGPTREVAVGELFGRATEDEQDFLMRLLLGELRQGALEGLMVEAIAKRVTDNGNVKVHPSEQPDIARDPIDCRSAWPATGCSAFRCKGSSPASPPS